jgi:heme/copper-type cytochrome/quinol oxidase subunit 4
MLEKNKLPLILSLIILIILTIYFFFKVINGEIGNKEEWRITFSIIGLIFVFISVVYFLYKIIKK